MNFKGKMRKKSGITLISLAVTIIILLILTGITIATITGNNGIIKNANEAKEQTEIAEEKEIVDRAIIQAMGHNKRGNLVEDELQEQLDKITDSGKTEVSDNGEEFEVVFVDSDRYYTVDRDGNIEGAYEIIEDKHPGNITVGKDGENLDGSEEQPYEIWCIEDLVFFAYDVANGNTYEGKTVKLELSLDFKSNKSYVEPFRTDYGEYGYDGELKTLLTSQSGFIPIGSIYDIDTQNFSGTFDGQNNSINNLYINFINNDGENDIKVGFFTRNRGTITNLKLLSINIIYSRSIANVVSSIGGICGQSSPGTVKNCLVTGNISSNAPRINVGGVTGTHSR